MANIETIWLIVQVSVYTVFYGSSSFIDTELSDGSFKDDWRRIAEVDPDGLRNIWNLNVEAKGALECQWEYTRQTGPSLS